MQQASIDASLGSRICEDILAVDSSIIFASIASMSGFEVASAIKASASLLIGADDRLREKYASMVAMIVASIGQSEGLFGKATRIVVTFEKNLRLIIVPLHSKDIFVVAVTTRESEAKSLAFQISKLLNLL